MAKFSKDVDILKYESVLFTELYLSNQVLISGTGGSLSGTTFTVSGVDFVSAQILVGGVIYLQSSDGVLDGVFEIISVDSSTVLTVSVLREDSEQSSVAPMAATNISYRVSTFGPQAVEAGFHLTEYFGIKPGNPASDIGPDDIMSANVLKQSSTFLVISSVYAMLAGQVKDENFWEKSLYYRRLFEKARERCRLSIDVGSDGVADITELGGSVKLTRA
ncbi:MAG: hypothetical protein FVQ80_01345 [Planctomycetes bacterium]|nr:hypothetical protein [Planctomycetota bacterium]